MKKWAGRLLTGTLCLMLMGGNGFALGEETASGTPTASPQTTAEATPTPTETSEVRYTAIASAALKVRRSAEDDASGNGSITKGDVVYIIDLGDEWSKVDIGRNVGYVRTGYLSDIHEYAQGTEGAEVTPAPSAQDSTDAEPAADTAAGFKENFVAYTYKAVVAKNATGSDSKAAFSVSKYEKVTVSLNTEDGWSYIHYRNSYGYVPTNALFKWDRIDPYAGDIPGCDVHTGLAFLNHSTDIRSYNGKGNKVLKTINPGSAVAVDTIDEKGRYPLPYWRTMGYVEQSDISYIIKVVPWAEAKSGDLISCMSTFYAVGIHTLQYQGRNWNIYLGTSFISNTIVQPGETENTYNMMGPYRASTGYHHAPIMSQHALWGYGGGCCQVNTTLYNALIQVPILINWRKVHTDVGIYYCPVGFDAAVGGGDTTMIFTNTLPYAIRINFFMSDGDLTLGIFRA
jgi:uncharacterized protein YgiM (DUF1202 family)